VPNAAIHVLFALVLAASGSAGLAGRQSPTTEAAPGVQPFADWLAGLRKEALDRGITPQTVAEALSDVQPLPVVVERDRTQAERTLSIEQYLKRRLDRRTVLTAREMAARHAALLQQVSSAYGVPPSIIVAIWGLESNFGRFSGIRPTIPALATLAYDNRRASLFREELISALRILDHGDVDLARMKGSWAGAMGQPQFMPSSYLKYAVDFDHDGRKDIWDSEADVFASIANYLKQNGWNRQKDWGWAVKLPKGSEAALSSAVPLRTEGCEAMRQMSEARTLARWRNLGVRPVGRGTLPRADTVASLVRTGSRSFLVLDSYAAVLQYNCAHAYALAVVLLSNQISVKAPARR
jgi:membrane-bound lytic murein transglycosylase B